ncbi:MAG TPA: DUF2157 domain-containing protein [Burkholderiales bacterium]|nr:DUF2157 domain-containing protein [Burkholderiales bacterium]
MSLRQNVHMNPSSRTEAQQCADEIGVFQHELGRLEREGILTLSDDQRRKVADHQRDLLAKLTQVFDIDRDAQSRQLSIGMRVASFLGALALAASVFFLFYQFWGWFPETAQVAILLVAAFGAFGATFAIQRRDGTGYFTKLAAMVAFACFVLNIAMLGQIFDITPSDKALLPWAALALLLAYACNLRLLLAAGILCLIAFVSARTGTWSGMYWLYFGERPENFFPAAVALLFVPHFLDHRRFDGFAATYRVFGLLTLFLPMLVLANWGQISYLDFDRSLIQGFYQVLGFAGSAAAVWLGTRRHWPDVVNTGLTFFVIFLYTKMYDWWWEIMPKYLFFLVIALSAVLLLVVFRRLRTSRIMAGGNP